MATFTKDSFYLDDEYNDDWMKKLPGYADEISIHEELEKKRRRKPRATAKFRATNV